MPRTSINLSPQARHFLVEILSSSPTFSALNNSTLQPPCVLAATIAPRSARENQKFATLQPINAIIVCSRLPKAMARCGLGSLSGFNLDVSDPAGSRPTDRKPAGAARKMRWPNRRAIATAFGRSFSLRSSAQMDGSSIEEGPSVPISFVRYVKNWHHSTCCATGRSLPCKVD